MRAFKTHERKRNSQGVIVKETQRKIIEIATTKIVLVLNQFYGYSALTLNL